jgi:hypothetical protein
MPFFFGVLFIQDTKLFVFESDTAKAEGTIFYIIRIIDMGAVFTMRSTIEVLTREADTSINVFT